MNPRDVVPSSIMPRYGWLAETELEVDDLGEHLAALRTVGVPYTDEHDRQRPGRRARRRPRPRATPPGLIERYGEATTSRAFDGDARAVTEMDALVAYLQMLGRLTDKASEQQQLAGR